MEAGSKFKPGEFYKQVKGINPVHGGLTHGQVAAQYHLTVG
jgi:hypothetical protein